MAQPEMNVQTREAEAASMPSPEMQFRSSLNSARPSQHPFVSSASASGEDADTIKGVRKPVRFSLPRLQPLSNKILLQTGK
jgi:hypothetical protein